MDYATIKSQYAQVRDGCAAAVYGKDIYPFINRITWFAGCKIVVLNNIAGDECIRLEVSDDNGLYDEIILAWE